MPLEPLLRQPRDLLQLAWLLESMAGTGDDLKLRLRLHPGLGLIVPPTSERAR